MAISRMVLRWCSICAAPSHRVGQWTRVVHVVRLHVSGRPAIFLEDADLVRLWKSNTRVFLFVPDFLQKKVDEVLGANKLVYAPAQGRLVYTNHNFVAGVKFFIKQR